MPHVDKYINELRRAGESQLVLLSDAEPRVIGKDGERVLGEKVGHKDVTALIEEIVPPRKFADLVMMEPVDFEYEHPAGVLAVRVVPGPSIWRVTIKPKDELAPLTEEEEQDAAGEGDDAAEEPEAAPSGKSWNELERIVGKGRDDKDDDGGEEKQDDEGEEKQDDEGDGEDADDGDADDAEMGAILVPPAAPPTDAGEDEEPELGAMVPPKDEPEPDQDDETEDAGEPGDKPEPDDEPERDDKPKPDEEPENKPRSSLEGALARPRDTGEFHVELADEHPEKPDLSVGSTVQLSSDDLASVAQGRIPPGMDNTATVRFKRPQPSPEIDEAITQVRERTEEADRAAAAKSEHPTNPRGPVQPLEIDFRDDDLPSVSIERLDVILDRAWTAGATAVLLRDNRAPAMGLAGRVLPLPNTTADDGRVVHEILDQAATPSHVDQLDIEGFCRFVYRTGGASKTLVRCTMVRDSGALFAWVRRIGDEHLPSHASGWLPVSVRNLMPETGLVLVAGPMGQGKTTTATALTAMCHQAMDQTLMVADPLERRLPDEGVGVLQRQIPEDVPNAGRAVGDALRLEARLVLVDIPRPEAVAVDLLALAGQGRLVIATWTASSSVAAVEALMDALPPSLSHTERARRTRNLRSVVGVRLMPARTGGVLPIFETLQLNQVVLSAVTEARLGASAGTDAQELCTLSFEASMAALKSRGLI